MKDRIQIALNKLRKAKVKNTTKLSAVSDAQDLYDEFQDLESKMDSLATKVNQESVNILAMKEETQASYDEWMELADSRDDVSSKLFDALALIEEKANDLGAAPFEFMPEYNEMLNATDNVGLEDPFNSYAYDLFG